MQTSSVPSQTVHDQEVVADKGVVEESHYCRMPNILIIIKQDIPVMVIMHQRFNTETCQNSSTVFKIF